MHAAASGACGREKYLEQQTRQPPGSRRNGRAARQPRFDALLGLERQPHAVARHEFEQAQHQFRLDLEALRRAEMDALAVHAEIGLETRERQSRNCENSELACASLVSRARAAAR